MELTADAYESEMHMREETKHLKWERTIEKYEIREATLKMDNARRRILQPAFQRMNLTPGLPRILNKLLTQDGMTQRKLAELCFMDVGTLSRALDKLEESGYLLRTRDPDCRRSFRIVLTEEGRSKAEEIHAVFEEVDGLIWNDISEEEMKQFLDVARRIVSNLEQQSSSFART